MAKACTLINEAMKGSDPKALRLQDLAKDVGLTPRYLHKIFKEKTGLTPKEYGKAAVVKDSAGALPTPDPSEGFDYLDLNSMAFDELPALQESMGQESGLEYLITQQSLPLEQAPDPCPALLGEQDHSAQTVSWGEPSDFGLLLSFPTPDLIASDLAAAANPDLPDPGWEYMRSGTPLTAVLAPSGGIGETMTDWSGSRGDMTASRSVNQDFVWHG